ncbi:MarR family transcriptional regulator [Thermopolyspora sp. NPDC052614]|uniref:MarR family winged helix-turn-helix transcriptional regulator n=1 Tax=Thermopolyspora sp. NPDC052614 TaxID=3155682 RepID=UPI003444EECB
MNDGDERSRLVGRIGEVQRDLARLFADPRSLPMFDSNLTMRQLKVIMILAFHDAQSGQDLSRRLGVGLATVTGIIDRLVAQHLVERHEDPADRRVRRVSLTDTGRRLADDLLDTGLGHHRALLDYLDLDTLRALETVMRKIQQAAAQYLADRVRDAGQTPPPAPARSDQTARHSDPAPDPVR